MSFHVQYQHSLEIKLFNDHQVDFRFSVNRGLFSGTVIEQSQLAKVLPAAKIVKNILNWAFIFVII